MGNRWHMDSAKDRFIAEYKESYPEELTGAYDILECLRCGEGTETLLAVSKADGGKVVIKCYDKAHPLFQAEGTGLLAHLEHPFIPAFLEERESEACRFVIREYIEGQTLAEYALDHIFTEREVIDIGIRLCGILQYLHTLMPPVVHRDIKPQNIIRKEDGSVFLIDFGISRTFAEEKSVDTIWCGTREYAAPEQYGYMQTGVYSDIYSLGIVLTWMVTGESTPIYKPSSPLEKILAKCTAFDPANRYQDVGEIGRRLRELLPEQSRKRKKKRVLLLSVSFLAVVTVSVLLFMFYRKLHQGEVRFKEPLIEEAVRAMLDKPDEILTKQDLEQVTQIYIIENTVYLSEEDLRAGLEAWEEIGTPYGEITSIEDLREMPNMRKVMIWGQHITDLSPLEELSDLLLVDLRQNDISDLSALADKQKLWYIGFNQNPLQDISVLDSCPALKSIDFNNTGKGYSGEVFLRMGDVDFLDVANSADVCQYLEGRTISEFKIGSPYQTDLECIKNINIRHLVIYYSEIMDISALTGRTDITYLDMCGCSIKDVTPLLSMPNLHTVVVSRNDREKMEELKKQGSLLFNVEYSD